MKIDRELQRSILETLKAEYPVDVYSDEMPQYEDENFVSNMFYLAEHGLIKPRHKRREEMGAGPSIGCSYITAAGIDFLEQDGGISAILKTVNVRIDREDLRAILEARLKASEIPAEKQSEILKAIKNLPAEGLKKICMYLLSKGLDSVQDVYRLIEKIGG